MVVKLDAGGGGREVLCERAKPVQGCLEDEAVAFGRPAQQVSL